MKKISIAIMVLVVALASCKKTPEVNLKYVDVERNLITVGTTTATVQCDYDYIATLKKAYFYYGEGENETNMNIVEMRVVQNTLYVDLAGLCENTTYSYYYEFVNGFNSMRTALKTFKTEVSGGGEEPPTPPEIMLPTVITASVTEITANSAKGGGEVTNDGGAEVIERGICWSISANPTVDDNHIAAGVGTGAFTAMMSGLVANTTYHVRAYATNEVGTAYGLDRKFTTLSGGGSGAPEGAIDGLFSVSPTKKVMFSQGNLQYQASTNTWRFAENQWNYVGGQDSGNVYENGVKCDNMQVSAFYEGWIDLYCWGTSGWDCGNVYYHPYDKDGEAEQYGPGNNSLIGEYANADWGVYNSIVNGGNQPGLWRTLSLAEWHYLVEYRNQASDKYSLAQVNGVHGCVLLPDDWNCPSGLSFIPQSSDWTTNVFSEQQWIQMETNGAVFLPAGGSRNSVAMMDNDRCEYHTTTSSHNWASWHYMFNIGFVGDTGYSRTLAAAVRLVQDPTPSLFKPAVETLDVTSITSNSATCSGEVTNDGGAEVIERGICWSISANPTVDDYHIAAGVGTGAFTAMMSGLVANTTYHVRAYATNEVGTAYGLDREFTTLSGGGSEVPEGAIDGLFSVGPTKKVYFSQGNLQYQASTNTWRFAEHQWDFVGSTVVGYGEPGGTVSGSSNHFISEMYDGWIDLFGWGTSGWNNGNVYHQPYDYETLGGWNADWSGYGYGPTDGTNYNNSLTGIYANSDWGVFNSISNGCNLPNQWRTLTQSEWDYIFNERVTASGIRYAMARVNDVNGIVLLPDYWDSSTYQLNDTNQSDTGFSSNVIDISTWIDTMQENGAVFLPASGSRNGTAVFSVNYFGYYWSSTYKSAEDAYSLGFYDHHEDLPIETDCSHVRSAGLSVRLVQDANLQNRAR